MDVVKKKVITKVVCLCVCRGFVRNVVEDFLELVIYYWQHNGDLEVFSRPNFALHFPLNQTSRSPTNILSR